MTRLLYSLLFLTFLLTNVSWTQCPMFTTPAQITAGCPGSGACDVCPGDALTIQLTGTGLPAGGTVDFYYSTNPSFNPNNGQGTFMGSASVIGIPVVPCATCPFILGTMVQGCAVPDPQNEFVALWSGSGFTVADLNLNFATQNSSGGGQNSSIGNGCAWGTPTAALMGALQSNCPGGNIIAATPGTTIPQNALVLAFTSNDANYAYDLSLACAAANLTIYVIQNSCIRTGGAFTNQGTASPGIRTHSISLGSCPSCTSSVSYNTASLSGSQGDFVISWPLPLPIAVNIPCGNPIPLGTLPPIPPPPSETVSINWTVPANLCNGGPYYISAIPNPLSASCPQVQANTSTFDVVCPTPTITPPASLCDNGIPFDLNTLLDAPYAGTWSSVTHAGNVSSTGMLNLTGVSSTVAVSFVPAGCGTTANALIPVGPPPVATINPSPPVCSGSTVLLTITLSGSGPFTFDVLENGGLLQSFTGLAAGTQTISVTPSAPSSTYEVVNLTNGSCNGADKIRTINVTPSPEGNLTLTGSSSLCAGETTTLELDFPQGSAPWSYVLEVDGSPQTAVSTSANPTILTISPTNALTSYELTSVASSGCTGTATGSTSISVSPASTATVAASNGTPICENTSIQIPVTFTGTGPWTFTYDNNGSSVNTVTTINNQYSITITPSIGSNSIDISNLTTNSGVCIGNPSGSYVVDVEETPTADLSGNEFICDGAAATLEVNFTGTGPFTFEYTSGSGGGIQQETANSSPYFFTVSPSGSETYSPFSVSSDNCAGTATGAASVTVEPAPEAQLATGTTTVCNGETAMLQVDFIGSAPFNFQYSIDNIIQPTVTSLSNTYMLPITNGVGTYAINIESVNDVSLCSGTFSGTHNVSVVSGPSGILSGDANICGGGNSDLTLNFTGTAPFQYVLSINNVNQAPATSTTNSTTLTFPHSATTTYELISVNSGSCLGTASGTATVTLQSGPTASFTSVTDTICKDGGIVIPVTLSGGGPYTLYYSVNGIGDSQTNITGNTLNLMFNTWSPGLHDVQLDSVTNGTCTGIATGFYSLLVQGDPFTTLSGDPSLCVPGMADLLVDFIGDGPFSFTYETNGGNPQTIQNITTNPYTLTVSATTSSTYTIVESYANGCTAVNSGQASVTIGGGLSATLSGTQTYCTNGGTGVPLVVTFMGGTPPYQYVYSSKVGASPSAIQPTVTTSNNPDTLWVFPTVGTSYILNLVTTTDCGLGTVSGTANVTVFSPSSAEIVSPNTTICNPGMVQAEIDFTGTGPFILNYTLNGIAQAPDTTDDDPYFLPLNISSNTNLVLTQIESPGCIGQINGSGMTFTIVPSLVFSAFDLTCDAVAGDYTITGLVTGGTAPYTVIQGGGSMNGGFYTSGSIPLANPYDIWITDASMCDTIRLMGVPNCNCVSDAGTMSLTPIDACINGVTVVATFNNDATLDNDDIIQYVLHTDPGNVIGTVLGESATPSFNYIAATMMPEVTYYISAIVGNPTGAGTVDYANDPCYAIAPGTPVVWHAAPTAVLSGDFDVCPNVNQPLTVTFTGENPFTYSYTANGSLVQGTAVTTGTTDAINTNVSDDTGYVLMSVADANCPGTASGSALINVHPAPQITNISINCNATNQTYILNCSVVHDSLSEIVLSGSTTGVLNTQSGFFTSSPIPWGTAYEVIASDVLWMCGQDMISATPNCLCATNAGTMNQTQIDVCLGTGAVQATFNNDANLETDDVSAFVLHTEAGNTLGTVLEQGASPSFSFIPATMTVGVTYYISAIAGNATPAGDVDVNDACFSVASGTPVVWHTAPTATLSGDFHLCPNDNQALTVTLTGQAPFDFSYTNNGNSVQAPTVATGTSTVIDMVYAADTQIILESVSDANCAGTVSGAATINVHPAPQISNISVDCDAQAQIYVLNFDVNHDSLSTLSLSGSTTGSFDALSGQFISNPLPWGATYDVIVSDMLWMCGQDAITAAPSCNCLTNAGTMGQTQIDACVSAAAVQATFNQDSTLDANDVFYFILHTAPGNALGNVIARGNTPSFPFVPGSMFPEVVYYISAIAGDPTTMGDVDLNDPCHSISAGTPVVWHAEPTAFLDGNYNICAGESQPLTIFFTGQAPFNFSYSTNGNVIQAPPLPSGTNVAIGTTLNNDAIFELLTVADANCPGIATGTATIDVHPAPQITNVIVSCDAPSQTYIVEFDVNHDSLSSVTITGSINGAYDTLTGHFISAPVPWGNDYKAVVTDLVWLCGQDSISGLPNCNCTTFAGMMSQTPLSFCAEETAIVAPATGTVLEGDDKLTYYLTTAQGPNVWTILGANDVPEFNFNAGLTTVGQTYYIVAVAGDTLYTEPGGVNGGDPCRSVALGTPVSWRAPVTAFMSGNTEICTGDDATLQIMFEGVAPFLLEYLINGVNPTQIQSNTDNFTLTVTPPLSANYSPISVSDAGGCVGTVSGGGAVSVLLPPNIIDVSQTCDFINDTYQITFKIANGAAPNPIYMVNGLAGTLIDTTFISDPISNAATFSLTVTTAVGCSATLTGSSTCVCTTSAGTIQSGPLSVCASESLIFTHNGDFNLDTDDVLRYILFEDPATLPIGVLMQNSAPQFDFDPISMTVGQTYYIAAIAGNDNGSGNLDFTDPCLNISPPTAVVFNSGPTATLMGNFEVCAGADTLVTAHFSGVPPFLFSYQITNANGSNTITLPSFIDSFTFNFMDILGNQSISLISISDANCMGTASGTATITLKEGPKAVLTGPTQICPGAMATLALTLSGGLTYDVEVSDGVNPPIVLTGIMDGHTFEVMPSQNATYMVTALTSPDAECVGEIGATHTVDVAGMTVDANVQQYGIYQISCFGESDGQIEWQPTGGAGGYTYDWGIGLTGSTQSGLEAGQYMVTVTDQGGCTGVGETLLTEPNPIVLDWSITMPSCLGLDVGSILLDEIMGGNSPYSYTIEPDVPAGSTGLPVLWDNLAPDSYAITATDINGCASSDTITILAPNSLTVDLGPDVQELVFGDSVNIEALVNQSHLSFINWQHPGTVAYPDSMFLGIRPLQTTAVIVTVGDSLGCTATDRIVLAVEQTRRVYIPNIFHGDGNGISDGNHIIRVYGGPDVEEIEFFEIYDRWGEMVYRAENFEPNSQTVGWDGQFGGKKALLGVYVYRVMVRFIDGERVLYKDDVTLIR